MTRFLAILTLPAVLLGLSACGSLPCGDPHPYSSARPAPRLKAPPGVVLPSPDPAYRIGAGADAPAWRADTDINGLCLVRPPQVVPQGAGKAKTVSADKKSTTAPRS